MKHDSKVLQVIESLEREREQLLQELLGLHEALKAEVDPDVGQGDPDLVERDRIISFIREYERQLELLDRSLEQARQGKYGICERCQEPIDPARLEAVPDTTFCIKCKTILERKRGHIRAPLS